MSLIWDFNRLRRLLSISGLEREASPLTIFRRPDQIIVHIKNSRSISNDNFFRSQWGFDPSYSPYLIFPFVFDVDCCVEHLSLGIFGVDLLFVILFLFHLFDSLAVPPK